MGKLLVILESGNVLEEQSLSLVTKKPIEDKIEYTVLEPVNDFNRGLPDGTCGIIVGGGLPSLWRSPVYHQDHVESIPHGFELIATSNYCIVQAMAPMELPVWTVQFHPEISFGINNYFANPVEEWGEQAVFDDEPNRRLIDNFVDIYLR